MCPSPVGPAHRAYALPAPPPQSPPSPFSDDEDPIDGVVSPLPSVPPAVRVRGGVGLCSPCGVRARRGADEEEGVERLESCRDRKDSTDSSATTSPGRSVASSDSTEYTSGGPEDELRRAVVTGDASALRRALEANLDVNARLGAGGVTPLHVAAWHGKVDVARALLAAGADPRILNSECQSARQMAREMRHEDVEVAIRIASTRLPGNVQLNIYDLGHHTAVRCANYVLRVVGTGAFHAAIEVYGREYSFGWAASRAPGIFCFVPRQCPHHTFRESIPLGKTTMPLDGVEDLIDKLRKQWLGCTYDFLTNNCTHFCNMLAGELGVQRLPTWVTSLAKVGSSCNSTVTVVTDVANTAARTVQTQLQGGLLFDCCSVRNVPSAKTTRV